MTDERLVETVMDALPDLPLPGPNYTQGFVKHLAANEILAALEADGYAIYRPDDCQRYWMVPGNNRIERHRGHLWADQGPERDGELSPAMRDGRWVDLVPVGGDQ